MNATPIPGKSTMHVAPAGTLAPKLTPDTMTGWSDVIGWLSNHGYRGAANAAGIEFYGYEDESYDPAPDLERVSRVLYEAERGAMNDDEWSIVWHSALATDEPTPNMRRAAAILGQFPLAGATTPGEPNAYPSTPGEFAARWNAWDAERRQSWLDRRVREAGQAHAISELADRLKGWHSDTFSIDDNGGTLSATSTDDEREIIASTEWTDADVDVENNVLRLADRAFKIIVELDQAATS